MLLYTEKRRRRQILRCTRGGQEITEGEEYWACNGSRICRACLPDFARQELSCCHEIRGKEAAL